MPFQKLRRFLRRLLPRHLLRRRRQAPAAAPISPPPQTPIPPSSPPQPLSTDSEPETPSPTPSMPEDDLSQKIVSKAGEAAQGKRGELMVVMLEPEKSDGGRGRAPVVARTDEVGPSMGMEEEENEKKKKEKEPLSPVKEEDEEEQEQEKEAEQGAESRVDDHDNGDDTSTLFDEDEQQGVED